MSTLLPSTSTSSSCQKDNFVQAVQAISWLDVVLDDSKLFTNANADTPKHAALTLQPFTTSANASAPALSLDTSALSETKQDQVSLTAKAAAAFASTSTCASTPATLTAAGLALATAEGAVATLHALWLQYGFAALDQVLKLVHAMDNTNGVQYVVQAVGKICSMLGASVVVASREQHLEAFLRLSRLPDFPPVPFTWHNVQVLCGLCTAMPSILDCCLGQTFFDAICGPVTKLYALPDNRISNQLLCGGDSQRRECKLDVDAIVGTSMFVVMQCSDALHLVRLRAEQITDTIPRTCRPEELANFEVLASILWNKDLTYRRLDASPSHKYLLWIEAKSSSIKHDRWPVSTGPRTITAPTSIVVLDIGAGRPVHMCKAYSHAHLAWWAGPDVLGLRATYAFGWQAVHVNRLDEAENLTTHYGRRGAVTALGVLGGLKFSDGTQFMFAWTNDESVDGHTFDSKTSFSCIEEDRTDPTGATFILKKEDSSFERLHITISTSTTVRTYSQLSLNEATDARTSLVWTI